MFRADFLVFEVVMREQIKSFLEVLRTGTEQGRLVWTEGSQRGRVYANVGNKSVHIWRDVETFTDDYEEHRKDVCAVALFDSAGEEVLREDIGDGDDGYALVSRVYADALFQGRNAGGFIDELIRDIDLRGTKAS